MDSARKELKRLENENKAKKSLADLNSTLTSINRMIEEFKNDAREQLLENNEEGFELIANSIFYFQDVKRMITSVKIQYQTYLKTSQVMNSIEGLRPVLKRTAKEMEKLPSFARNRKDFRKFQRGLLKGQLNMQAMSSMISTINPAASTTRSSSDLSALKESLLVGTNLDLGTSTATAPVTKTENDDFFDAINK